jgi:hypothetical protein|tara:strand:- start:833 stop:1246 length:414 start_codon:yes stop_codon:yes gene_type:complete
MTHAIGKAVKVHANLNSHCLSLQEGANPVVHVRNSVTVLTNAKFRVQPAGHKKIATKKRRGVVARIHGTLESVTSIDSDTFGTPEFRKVSYNPIDHTDRPYFYTVDDGQPICTADSVYLVAHESIESRTSVTAYVRR